MPNAEITFDRFHIMKIMNDAVDRVRREEAKDTNLLRRTLRTSLQLNGGRWLS